MARMYMNVDFKEVLDKLQRMESKLANEGTEKILEEAGEFMKNEFIGMAPRDTGALQASIDYRIKGTIVEVGVQTAKAKGRVPLYSWYQEFGTRKMAKICGLSYRNVCQNQPKSVKAKSYDKPIPR